MLTIYGKKQSRAARCLWLLEELGLKYTQIPLDTQKGETKTAEFLALNPAGKVPVLDDEGFVLRESVAINAYLVAKADTPLWPQDAQRRALIHQWTSWAVTETEVSLTAIFRAKRRAAATNTEVDPDFIADNLEATRSALAVLDQSLAVRPYVVGDTFTLGDVNAYTAAMLAPMFQDLSGYPAVKEWMARCSARPAWQRVTQLP